MTRGVAWTTHRRWASAGGAALLPRLGEHLAVGLRGYLSAEECGAMVGRVFAARDHWTRDFGGEQYSLGRAFYTHLETGRAGEYFSDVKAADARVESALPGAQGRVMELLAGALGATVRRRPGFCGPGVHVFPAGEKVAERGGVLHYDTEGLTAHQLARGQRCVSVVVMLQVPERGGGLRLWDLRYDGRGDHQLDDEEIASAARATVRYRAGDALFFDSVRLHQIRPSRGAVPRVSLTAHAVEVDRGVWECWW